MAKRPKPAKPSSSSSAACPQCSAEISTAGLAEGTYSGCCPTCRRPYHLTIKDGKPSTA